MKQPLIDYPRPQFRRDSYKCLNGYWEYKITKSDVYPASFDGNILVPFSPEAPLSGVNHILQPDEYLFYKLVFKLDDLKIKDKVFLHFLGVDQICDVYLNDCYLGHHEGGFLPFSFEIKEYLNEENTLVVRVKDLTDTSYLSRGKQKLKHGGIWYTPSSGIYFPVFIESVPNEYVESVKYTPDIDNNSIVINVSSSSNKCLLSILDKEYEIECNKDVPIKIDNPILWCPENPYLYDVKIKIGNDIVYSYFAMRKVSIIKDENNIQRIALNNKSIFMKGVLDQGYYKGGLLTPPTYDDYIRDIELVKSLGFNTIRKHIKIEIPRWYYECDKRGIIVWQDFVNGGSSYKFSTIAFPLITGHHKNDHNYHKFARDDEEGRKKALIEFKETINYLYNSPSIMLWTIFNEGWGQFDSKMVLEEMKKIDNTRLYDHASGWHDQGIGDIKSMHVYFKKVKLPKKEDRCIILSEFGGLVLPIKDHIIKGNSVYRKFKNKDDFLKAYKTMINRDVISNIPKGLSASIYTQLSDVEEETNGFITYDREVIKFDPKDIKEINDLIHL